MNPLEIMQHVMVRLKEKLRSPSTRCRRCSFYGGYYTPDICVTCLHRGQDRFKEKEEVNND